MRVRGSVRRAGWRAEVIANPVGHDQLGRRPHVQLRIEFSRHPFDHDLCFLQRDQLDPGGHIQQGVTSNKSVSSFAVEI
jgi:hypothetical protein